MLLKLGKTYGSWNAVICVIVHPPPPPPSPRHPTGLQLSDFNFLDIFKTAEQAKLCYTNNNVERWTSAFSDRFLRISTYTLGCRFPKHIYILHVLWYLGGFGCCDIVVIKGKPLAKHSCTYHISKQV